MLHSCIQQHQNKRDEQSVQQVNVYSHDVRCFRQGRPNLKINKSEWDARMRINSPAYSVEMGAEMVRVERGKIPGLEKLYGR